MVAGDPPRFTLDELADSSGVSKRTIRYYIAEGAISAAGGRSRSAYYTPMHLQELEQVKHLRKQGFSIAEIRGKRSIPVAEVKTGVEWERFVPHPHLELHIRADAPPYVRLLAERFLQEAETWLGEAGSDEVDVGNSVQFD